MKKHFENPTYLPPSESPFKNSFSHVYLPSTNTDSQFSLTQKGSLLYSSLLWVFFTEYIFMCVHNFPILLYCYLIFYSKAYYNLFNQCPIVGNLGKFLNLCHHKHCFINFSCIHVILHVFKFFCRLNTQNQKCRIKGCMCMSCGQIWPSRLPNRHDFLDPSPLITLQSECQASAKLIRSPSQWPWKT